MYKNGKIKLMTFGFIVFVLFCMSLCVSFMGISNEEVYADSFVESTNKGVLTSSSENDSEINLNNVSINQFENVLLIGNSDYFYLNPSHHKFNKATDNPIGTCTTIAMQLLPDRKTTTTRIEK